MHENIHDHNKSAQLRSQSVQIIEISLFIDHKQYTLWRLWVSHIYTATVFGLGTGYLM
jgi:hypothetical protein